MIRKSGLTRPMRSQRQAKAGWSHGRSAVVDGDPGAGAEDPFAIAYQVFQRLHAEQGGGQAPGLFRLGLCRVTRLPRRPAPQHTRQHIGGNDEALHPPRRQSVISSPPRPFSTRMSAPTRPTSASRSSALVSDLMWVKPGQRARKAMISSSDSDRPRHCGAFWMAKGKVQA